MTITKRFITYFKDIKALRLVCKDCKVSMSLSTEEELNLPEKCPNCRKDWFLQRSIDWVNMQETFKSLAQLRMRSTESPCTVQLEFDLPS
jgi:hypothetical protein